MKYISISITASDDKRPEFRDIVNFLWDFNLLYETSRLIVDPRYEAFRFTPRVYTRNGRPLQKEDLLHFVELSLESPLKFTAIVAATAAGLTAIWVLIQIVQAVEQWPLHDAKLAADVRKTQLDVIKTELEIEKLQDEREIRRASSHQPSTADKLKRGKTAGKISGTRKSAISPTPNPEEFQNWVGQRDATKEINSIFSRLERSPVKIEDVDIKIVTENSQ